MYSSYSLMAPPPPKRKRSSYALNHGEDAQCSVIKDLRVAPSQSLELSCPIITVLVGPSDFARPFYVHSAAICARSPFFASAMKPEWASQRHDPNTIELPDNDPSAFSLYMSFLYTGKLPVLQEPTATSQRRSQNLSAVDNETELHPFTEPGTFTPLAYAYILGERLLDTSFKNAITDTYVLWARGTTPLPGTGSSSVHRRYPDNEEIRIIYAGTTESAPLRRLIVDIWCCRGKLDWIEQDADLPPEFLVDVVKAMFRVRPDDSAGSVISRPWKNGHEQYHENEKTDVKTSAKANSEAKV